MDAAKTGTRARQTLCPAQKLCLGMLAGLALLTSVPARADTCTNPNALGTSRTIVVDPREHPRIGTMQYSETLPLRDKEVVLTFDDGPIPKHSNAILDILASECVKATFFIVGRMAKEHPEGVRKLIRLGHSVGTHSENHPLSMNRMPIEKAQQEIEEGIANTAAALGDPALLSPFFRIPGLLRAGIVEDYLASRGIQTWSADFPADDWRHVSSQTVHNLAISRIKAKGKGILLLHDIQPRTVAALPGILRDLKEAGYRIVHVEAATPDRPKTPTQPQDWQLHPVSETVAIARWHKVPGFAFAHRDMLPAPEISPSDQMLSLTENFDRMRRPRGSVPLPEYAPWPRISRLPAPTASDALPVPALSLFDIAERHGKPIKALVQLPHHARQGSTTQTADNDGIARLISGDKETARTIPGAIPPGLSPTAAAAPR